MHHRCHFDECARRNLFALTDLSYRRDDKKIEICNWQRSRRVKTEQLIFNQFSDKQFSEFQLRCFVRIKADYLLFPVHF